MTAARTAIAGIDSVTDLIEKGEFFLTRSFFGEKTTSHPANVRSFAYYPSLLWFGFNSHGIEGAPDENKGDGKEDKTDGRSDISE
jgi:hypothetical protein